MSYDPKIHHRRSIRLPGYDYTRAGAYYVTLVTQGRVCLFGDVTNGVVVLNEFGRIAAETWQWLERQYPYVELGVWMVMPNHLHGIIILHEPGRINPARGWRDQTQTVGWVDWRVQNRLHKKDQHFTQYRRPGCLAA